MKTLIRYIFKSLMTVI